jgi:hypothetical protein
MGSPREPNPATSRPHASGYNLTFTSDWGIRRRLSNASLMRKAIKIDPDEADRRALTSIVTDRYSPQKHVSRAQIVLLIADGCGTMDLPTPLRWSRSFGQVPGRTS